ncbi:carboxypeptidase-like regulatory domain-containing protein [uncultured Aquimarina sp.]|uniref:carboxypeptidase-like regulatory domain-containing protein n=1 Tax=uncultured Aquimarina sp. TaxID=575652 RepID=UPI00262F1DBC|nr:carboxypeptidase-like regulatory domain-containing protein [uncultured Aquimarina sp.]
MKKIKINILFLLINLSLFAQNSVVGILKDSETGQPISYVNIGIVEKDKGTVSTEEGKFELEIPLDLMNDTIKLSSIGYQSKSMIAKEFVAILKANSIIGLLPKVTELNEVVVINKKLKKKILGNKTKSKKMRGAFNNAVAGNEVGIKIKIKDSPTYVKKFHTNVVSNTSEKVKFRLNFYSLKDGLPYEKIIKEDIIFSVNVKEGQFTLDLKEYNIVVEEDFYSTIELLENQKPEEKLFFSAGLLGNTMVYRYTSQGEWTKSNTVGIGFNYTVKY